MTPEIVRAIAKAEAEKVKSVFTIDIVETGDATPAVLQLIETESYEKGTIEYTINAIKDDGLTGLSIKRVFGYKNDGTTLTLSTEADILVDNDFTTADIAASVSDTTIQIMVTGEAATNITWTGVYEQTKITTEVLPP